MKLGTRRTIYRAVGTMIVCLLGTLWGHGQAGQPGTEQKPLMAEDAFKNVQVLRGIPVKEFMGTMGFFAASLSLNCTDCHVSESSNSWDRYADDTQLKNTARRMVLMMNNINKANFGGGRMVTCYTCHRGNQRPEVIPSLAEQYGAPPPGDPDKAEILGQGIPGPSADQILDKYIRAIGGAQALAKVTSFAAKGTYEGYDSDFAKVPVDVYAKSPKQLAMVVHKPNGDRSTIYDGQNGWIAAPETDVPVPVMPLAEGDLEGAKVDALLSFPAGIKQDLTKWRVGFPPTTIDDKPVEIVEGTTSGGSRVKLYFDKTSGLLVRQVRYTNTLVGTIPMHVEYSDYRLVAGVKMPFHWVTTWTDGQTTTQLTSVQPNATIDPSKFNKPTPPTAPAVAPKPAAVAAPKTAAPKPATTPKPATPKPATK
jgi:photosynthetic reaction center cytochrome c subunit